MTTSSVQTLKSVLSKATPGIIESALQKADLGNMMSAKVYTSGAVTAAATIALPEKALAVLSARVLASGTAASLGTYLVADPAATPLLPPGGANVAVGIAAASSSATVAAQAVSASAPFVAGVTFPNTVTSVVIMYIPAPATVLTAEFAPEGGI